jgi:hypothetical protein
VPQSAQRIRYAFLRTLNPAADPPPAAVRTAWSTTHAPWLGVVAAAGPVPTRRSLTRCPVELDVPRTGRTLAGAQPSARAVDFPVLGRPPVTRRSTRTRRTPAHWPDHRRPRGCRSSSLGAAAGVLVRILEPGPRAKYVPTPMKVLVPGGSSRLAPGTSLARGRSGRRGTSPLLEAATARYTQTAGLTPGRQ